VTSRDLKRRPNLLLYTARADYPQRNALAATLAWAAADREYAFEVYYDAMRGGGHYGGGNPTTHAAGGLAAGGRHLEAVALALLRFETTVICTGGLALANTIAALLEGSETRLLDLPLEPVVDIYDATFAALDTPWPSVAVMVHAAPSPHLVGIDAYCYPEIFYRRAVGIESSTSVEDIQALKARGIKEVLCIGVPASQQESLRKVGLEVQDLEMIRDGDDYCAVTARLAARWKARRRGWLLGDPSLVASWLPVACREDRSAIYSIPQSRVISAVGEEIAADTGQPMLGRQYDDSDFFALSRLGQAFQLVDPNRPVLPILQTLQTAWSRTLPDPRDGEPSDSQLQQYAREGRILSSLVFWTGMLRETENLFALVDLLAVTDLRAGLALTAQSLGWRPSPLDLLTVPRNQGGVFPNAEILLASSGIGGSIESLLPRGRLRDHVSRAHAELERIGFPKEWWPKGWWATMDAPLIERTGPSLRQPVQLRRDSPYLRFRFHARSDVESERPTSKNRELSEGVGAVDPRKTSAVQMLQSRVRARVRDSRLSVLFDAYRPYEHLQPGPIREDLAREIQENGLSYMLSKSGFGERPRVLYREDEFVALNYTAGQWDGWTPFETVNSVRDLRVAEKRLLHDGAPGWLLGTVDTCLWAFSGELWHRAPGLAEIARFLAHGGSTGKLINVTPRVIARYARIISDEGDRPAVSD
jgi:hypothetical protein